ncbi:hypothetical protein N0Y54_29380 [Nostoc punctiforme UO1]
MLLTYWCRQPTFMRVALSWGCSIVSEQGSSSASVACPRAEAGGAGV